MAKTWLITGCSTGFGRVVAEAALARGDNVVASARKPATLADLVDRYPGQARVAVLDVTCAQEIADAVALACSAFGGIDVLVNNAGYGLVGAIEEAQPAEYRAVFETNLFGLVEVTRAALPVMRQRGGGRIVNFSSVGGITGRAGFGYYCATKFAVEGLSETLSEELAPFGIAVIIVEPAGFRTDFLGRSIATAGQRIAAYDETAGLSRSFSTETAELVTGDPERGVAVLLRAIDSDQPPMRLPLGKYAFDRIRQKLDELTGELDRWEAAGTDTEFIGAAGDEGRAQPPHKESNCNIGISA